ncbi:diadenosine tetraphosphate (Ap4A) HIT family hydrolase [Actinokineospora baliensis]|uniref:HIT family protein n=1 Tax=Actinokineospora baliensis TaxID=547056 RepID=UPI001EF81C00|nr:HIT family protein [Actinokineospora baliensis]MBM7770398.1 diadenosine tetraphosphate (Ap4A) HIT family hydrolase [Actinokineospora baliensis]
MATYDSADHHSYDPRTTCRKIRYFEMSKTMNSELPAVHSIDSCIFCRVRDGSMNRLVDETSNFYARLDNFPAARGHVEIVPKRHIVSFFELSPQEASEAYDLMRRIQAKWDAELNPDGYTIGVNEGRAAGRTIDHLHIHMIPRYNGDVTDPRGGIRQIFPNCDPSEWAAD